MPEGRTWAEVDNDYQASIKGLREQAQLLYAQMVDHVTQEAIRTGANIQIFAPGTVLPKVAASSPIAVRMDVTEATALYARQPHVDEASGEKHRSWSIMLDDAPEMPGTVRRGLTRMIEHVARLQGNKLDSPQSTLKFD